jgi:hypothetical protein
MNSRAVTLVLLALVLMLLGAVGYLVHVLWQLSPPAFLVGSGRTVTNTVTRKIYLTRGGSLTNQVPNWDTIESTNYQTYIENLRAVGCPEETIKDLIITDVTKLYARRRAELRAQGPPYEFWKPEAPWTRLSPEEQALQKQLRALRAEERALIKDLLGADLDTELARYATADETDERRYAFLPEEKRSHLRAIEQKYAELEEDIRAQARGLWLDDDEARMKALRQQKEDELAALLEPEEQEEYELRHSDVAQMLRDELGGFDPTEQEFRALYRLQSAFEREVSQTGVQGRGQELAQAALDEEARKVLGDTRFQEYKRAQDHEYKAMVNLTERFELSRDVANKLYRMKDEAERQKLRLEVNSNLPYEQLLAALQSIANETERSVAQELGGPNSPAWQAYKSYGSQWIGGLTESILPPPPPQPQTAQPSAWPNFPLPPPPQTFSPVLPPIFQPPPPPPQ